jgi:hypothetical protein
LIDNEQDYPMRIGTVVALVVIIGAGIYFWTDTESELAPSPPPLTGNPYQDDLRHLTWLLSNNWSWLEMRQEQGLDLETLEEECMQIVDADPTDRGFSLALRRYVAGIHDGHGSSRLKDLDRELSKRWPFSLVEAKEGLMVDGIDPATFSARTLRPGDLVLMIDGQSVEDVIAEQEKFEFASTKGARRRRAIEQLTKWTDKESFELKVHRVGRPEPESIRVMSAPKSAPVPHRSWRHLPKTFRIVDENTAYFCPGNFSPLGKGFKAATADEREAMLQAQYQEYRDTMRQLVRKRNLILDLRANPGGTDLLGQALALHLLEPGFRYYRLTSKWRSKWRTVSWTTIDDVGFGTPKFGGKVICLIDEKTFSVSDNLACCLRDCHPDIVFVGQPTGGGSGAPRKFILPSTGAEVRFCTMQVKAPNGEFVEGNGVHPDLTIRPSVHELLAHSDVVLEAAMKLLD